MIPLCLCGNQENSHYFRHEFNPQTTVVRYRSNRGDRFVLDANDWKGVKHEGKCSYTQCGADKYLHGSYLDGRIIKHDFIPSEVYFVRDIKFTLPLDTKCRVCKEELEEHKSLTHAFTTKVKISHKTVRDTVTISGNDEDQTIIWDT